METSTVQMYKCIKLRNAKSLKRNCVTRWIEIFHSTHDFIKLIDCVVESLNIIKDWDDKETLSKADGLRYAILNFEFLISLLVVSNIF